MKLIIDIPIFAYEQIIEMGKRGKLFNLLEAVAEGTPLQKGHGDLIDTNELEPDTEWNDYEDGFISYSRNQIKCAKVIIEADAESKVNE